MSVPPPVILQPRSSRESGVCRRHKGLYSVALVDSRLFLTEDDSKMITLNPCISARASVTGILKRNFLIWFLGQGRGFYGERLQSTRLVHSLPLHKVRGVSTDALLVLVLAFVTPFMCGLLDSPMSIVFIFHFDFCLRVPVCVHVCASAFKGQRRQHWISWS